MTLGMANMTLLNAVFILNNHDSATLLPSKEIGAHT
jgi:hypothetical protein